MKNRKNNKKIPDKLLERLRVNAPDPLVPYPNVLMVQSPTQNILFDVTW